LTPETKAENKNGGSKVEKLSKAKIREIIDDFVKEIGKAKFLGAKPAKTVIDFRNERKDGIERDIWYVPIDLLRYRKDNGRISSDVLHYECALRDILYCSCQEGKRKNFISYKNNKL